ncbi:MAG: GGDEF domain-containing protein [Alphaproteobacteria bacterium]
MEFFESNAQAQGFAEAAMKIMTELGVPPNPKNFAVWYSYCTEDYPDLNDKIDAILKDSRRFGREQTEEIYETFFGVDRTGEAIRDTTRRIQESVGRILEYVGQAGQDTAQYGQILEDFSGKLAVEDKAEDLRALVGGILSETHKMEKQSREVETQLRASSKEVVALRRNLEIIRQESLTDGLTGIANRKSFDTSLRQAAQEAVAEETGLCLLLADIDHFKKFNDTWGHQLGDQVLKLVAKTLVECIKGRDLAARYGGEEFAVILPHTRIENAVTLAGNICKTLATKKVIKRSSGDNLGTVTISIGAAAYRWGEDLGCFVRRADTALYAAKQAGRNRVLSEAAIESSLEEMAS